MLMDADDGRDGNLETEREKKLESTLMNILVSHLQQNGEPNWISFHRFLENLFVKYHSRSSLKRVLLRSLLISRMW